MNWLNQRISLLVILVGVILVCVLFLDGNCQRRHIEQLTNRQWSENNIVSQERRKEDSAQITRATANYVTRSDLRRSDNAMLDTLRKELVGPIKTLERTTKIIATRIEHLDIPVRDTVRTLPTGEVQKGFAFNYSKPPYLLKMDGTMFDGRLTIDYAVKSEFKLESHWKRSSLFGPKELELILTSKDPAVTVNQVQQFQIVEPIKFWNHPGVQKGLPFMGGLLVGLALDAGK